VADPELKWWHVRWRLAWRAISRPAIVSGKIIVPLCVLAVIGFGIIYLMQPWLFAKQMSKSERLNIIPAELPTRSESPLSNATIDVDGLSFQLPREEVIRTLQGDSIRLVRFRNGGELWINDSSLGAGVLDAVLNNKDVMRLFNQGQIRSKFELMQAAMYATPDQAKWWRFRSASNQRVEYLLFAKSLVLTESIPSAHPFSRRPIYMISATRFHGFQIGNPDTHPFEADLELFDQNDRYLNFTITGPEGHGQVLTQTEINALVASIRPPGMR